MDVPNATTGISRELHCAQYVARTKKSTQLGHGPMTGREEMWLDLAGAEHPTTRVEENRAR